jgi:hypothetical protein
MRKQGQALDYITTSHPLPQDTTYLTTPRNISDMEIIHTTHERAVQSTSRPSSAQNTPKTPGKNFYQQRLSSEQQQRSPRSRSHDVPRDTFWPSQSNQHTHSRSGSEDLRRPRSPPRPRKDSVTPNTDFDKLLRYQREIRSGNLEKVAPPRKESHAEHRGRLAPPRPIGIGGGYQSAPSTRPTTPKVPPYTHRKTKSSTKKIVEYIRTSADLLDETRHNLAGKISPPFHTTTFKHNPFSLTRKTSNSSVDSFYCAGEQSAANAEWASIPKCRLCRLGAEGPRGLCSSCEDDHRRPSLSSDDWDVPTLGSGSESGSDRRPTPPPKDTPPLNDREYHTATGQPTRPSKLELAEDEMRVKLGYVAKHHRVITPPPPSSRRGSIPIMIMGDEIGMHEEDEAPKDMKSWSTVYGTGDFEYFQKVDPEQEPSPLMISKDKEKKVRPPLNNRDTEFYKFYDEIL